LALALALALPLAFISTSMHHQKSSFLWTFYTSDSKQDYVNTSTTQCFKKLSTVNIGSSPWNTANLTLIFYSSEWNNWHWPTPTAKGMEEQNALIMSPPLELITRFPRIGERYFRKAWRYVIKNLLTGAYTRSV